MRIEKEIENRNVQKTNITKSINKKYCKAHRILRIIYTILGNHLKRTKFQGRFK